MTSYVSIDLETTGLDSKIDKIIEVGAVKVIDDEIVGKYSTLIQPHRKLEERVTDLTGITDEMLTNAPDIQEKIQEILDFIGELPILGHRIIFDFSFLKRAAVNTGMVFERQGIDTLQICRSVMPGEEKKTLTSACDFFDLGIAQTGEKIAGEDGHSHRAFYDAVITHLLYQDVKRKYETSRPDLFQAKNLIYKIKREQPASKSQKEHLRDLIKYHRIDVTVEIEYLSRNEASRLTDKIILKYGRIKK